MYADGNRMAMIAQHKNELGTKKRSKGQGWYFSLRLNELLSNVEMITHNGDLSTPITGVTNDSRQVEPGFLFVSIQGFKKDGHSFILDALRRGAAAIVTEKPLSNSLPVPTIQVTNGRRALARMSTTFYGYPAQKLKVIGVTGTNGKTTTTYLIENILSHAGYKTGLIGTIAYKINGRVYPAGRTTPESVQLQSLLREMVDNGVQHVVIEVSSHALALERVTGCEFDVAVFTNITQDHFDFHGTFENYLETKTKLFSCLGQGGKTHPFAVINVDDPSSEYILKHVPRAATVITYGLEQERAQFRALRQHWDARGTQLRLLTPAVEREVKLKILTFTMPWPLLGSPRPWASTFPRPSRPVKTSLAFQVITSTLMLDRTSMS